MACGVGGNWSQECPVCKYGGREQPTYCGTHEWPGRNNPPHYYEFAMLSDDDKFMSGYRAALATARKQRDTVC